MGVPDGVDVRAPGFAFFQVVGYAARVEDGESGGVEGILRDGDQDAGFGTRADDVQHCVDAG